VGNRVFLLGVGMTPFTRWPERGFRALVSDAVTGALADAGLADGKAVDAAWFGNCLMTYWGHDTGKGAACLLPLTQKGLLNDTAPIVNVEGGCATGSLALAGAYKEVRAGDADLTLAVGVEKLFDPANPHGILALFNGGSNPIDGEELREYYRGVAQRIGKTFENSPDHSLAMDTYAMQALVHQHLYGTTREEIAAVAAKNHNNGSVNPLAHYRFQLSVEEVLSDRMVADPLTRAMCAPLSDGAAAALLCSESFLRKQPLEVQRRAIPILGFGMSGGRYRKFDEPSLTRTAADRAYEAAGVGPGDVDLAEVHDATAFCEIYQTEMLRFCGEGEGGRFATSGASALSGRLPVNPSGGLVSRGHPLGATGLAMSFELATQLRREAGDRQVARTRIALQENGGGILGLGEAVAAVVLYGAPRN
jgi:acetyl-CoA acetyltransferase